MDYHTFTRKCDGMCDSCDCDESVRLPDDAPRESMMERIRTLEAECARLREDARRLDWLEARANEPGGLLLHDGSERGRFGLGLRPGKMVRTLREAIDTPMRSEGKEA